MAKREIVPPDPMIVMQDRRLTPQWLIYLESLSGASGVSPVPFQPALSGGATLSDVIAAFNTLRANLIAAGIMRAS